MYNRLEYEAPEEGCNFVVVRSIACAHSFAGGVYARSSPTDEFLATAPAAASQMYEAASVLNASL